MSKTKADQLKKIEGAQKKHVARGRPKGAKSKVKKPAKIAPVRIGAKGSNRAKKTPQGAEAKKHVETRRDKVIQEIEHANWKIPVIQSRSEINSKGEINAHDIMGVLRAREPYGMTIDYVVPELLAMLFATDYVVTPEYAFDRFTGARLIAFRLIHKSHRDAKELDPIWFDVNTIELDT